MTEEPIQPNHAPIWIDLASPDIEGSKAFYAGLFGWDAETVAPPEAGSYTVFRLGGKQVAAVATTMGEGQPQVWSTYVRSDDVDADVERARGAGGEVAMEPMDVFDSGRMAVLRDPTGAFISLWQPREHRGFEAMNQPGSFGWTELATRDVEAAKAFYGQVFGWGAETSGEGAQAYTEWKLDGQSIGGAMAMGEQQAGVPPHWMVYFVVEDVDASAARVQELGGNQLVPPMDFPGGRFAVVSDSHGAAFGLMIYRG
jgi:uncharacterized protein